MILITSQLHHVKSTLRHILLLAIVFVDLTANAVIILDDLNYLQQSKFEDYTVTLNESLDGLRMADDEFYRINKSFMRTKNEAMYVHYNGLDHFGSTIEAHVPRLYGYLGQPDGSGFATYTNGSLFLDDFFSIKYIIEPTDNTRDYTQEEEYVLYPEATDLDNKYYPVINEEDRYLIRENEDYFGLGIEVSEEIRTTEFNDHQPIYNQEKLLSLIDFNGSGQAYFLKHPFSSINYENVTVVNEGDGDYYTYRNDTNSDTEEAIISWHFATDSNNPYYFTLPSQYSKDNVSMRLNNQRYRFYSPYRKRQLTNASYNLIDDDQTFEIIIKEDELKANFVRLYEFDLDRYENLRREYQDNQFIVTNFKHNNITGQINIAQEKAYLLFSIPYDDSWQVSVDGQKVEAESVLNETLLAIPISQGQHEVNLEYKPVSVPMGIAASSLGLIILGLSTYLERKRKQT